MTILSIFLIMPGIFSDQNESVAIIPSIIFNCFPNDKFFGNYLIYPVFTILPIWDLFFRRKIPIETFKNRFYVHRQNIKVGYFHRFLFLFHGKIVRAYCKIQNSFVELICSTYDVYMYFLWCKIDIGYDFSVIENSVLKNPIYWTDIFKRFTKCSLIPQKSFPNGPLVKIDSESSAKKIFLRASKAL